MIDVSLIGNPNVGKTSLFNRITHSLEHVGNWHGVTVEKKEKVIMYDHNQIKMTDLPGLYSLTVYTPEEGITRDCVLGNTSNLIVNVCEVNNLARNLYLTLQLLEADVSAVLVINMMDELKKQGRVLNLRKIESCLKIPIVPMSAKYHSDTHLLMDVCLEHLKNPRNKVKLTYLDELPLEKVYEIIGGNVRAAGLKKRYAAIKVLENDAYIISKLNLDESQKQAIKNMGGFIDKIAMLRYRFIDEITAGAIIKPVIDEHHEMHEHTDHNVPLENCAGEYNQEAISKRHLRHHNLHKKQESYMAGVSKIDKIVLNKYLALPMFLLIMAAIFLLTFGLIGGNLSNLLETFIKKFIYAPATSGLKKIATPAWVNSLIGDGIIEGVGGVLIFLPQIVLLFLFLAFLEDSGYISRVAFMTDGLFRKIGLSGRSVFTMLMGFGCSATAILTARGLEDEMMRKKTVLLTPFMSCSARLPVYSAIAGAFFFRSSPFVIFALYALGALIAILMAALLQKIKRFKSGKLSFIMEIPPYRTPTLERVLQLIWHNMKVFLIRVGTVVFALNVIVWALSSFSLTTGFITGDGGAQAKSIMQTFAGLIAPVFKPLGFGNWKAVTALLSGLVAKEVVKSYIGSMGGASVVLGGGQLTAFCFLVFTLLYTPCFATLVAMRKETGFKWTLFAFVLQLLTAYVFALIVRGIALLFIGYTAVAVTTVIALVTGLIVVFSVLHMIKNRGKCAGCGGACQNCSPKSKDKKGDK